MTAHFPFFDQEPLPRSFEYLGSTTSRALHESLPVEWQQAEMHQHFADALTVPAALDDMPPTPEKRFQRPA